MHARLQESTIDNRCMLSAVHTEVEVAVPFDPDSFGFSLGKCTEQLALAYNAFSPDLHYGVHSILQKSTTQRRLEVMLG